MVKLDFGQCACSKKGTVYCRVVDKYRFTGEKCTNIGEKWSKPKKEINERPRATHEWI